MKQQVRAFAPATIANIVCGYDVLGFAADMPGDEVLLTRNDEQRVRLDAIEGDGGALPREVEKNVVSYVVQRYLEKIGSRQGVSITLYKNMPLNSGMGSSAASTVAALVAINRLMGEQLTREALMPLAMDSEAIACGSPHADNVAPSLLGGIVLVRSYQPLDLIRLPYPETLSVVLLHPQVDIPTRGARQMIRQQVALRDAVSQWGNIAGLVAGFCTKDIGLIGRSMVDTIIEPIRAMLIPRFYAMKKCAIDEGAIGFGISGSGPSVFALCPNEQNAKEVANKLQALLQEGGVASETYITKINASGARVLDEK